VNRHVRYPALLLLACTLLGACADSGNQAPTTRPMTIHQRQQEALRDPFGYKLTDDDFPSVTGGGTSEFDRKAFKRDMDTFWNP
jgi:hypothetical protein